MNELEMAQKVRNEWINLLNYNVLMNKLYGDPVDLVEELCRKAEAKTMSIWDTQMRHMQIRKPCDVELESLKPDVITCKNNCKKQCC